jgi:hypothetical protein
VPSFALFVPTKTSGMDCVNFWVYGGELND